MGPINGNVFNVLAMATKALRTAGYPDHAKEMKARVTMGEASTYDDALTIIQEYVDLNP